MKILQQVEGFQTAHSSKGNSGKPPTHSHPKQPDLPSNGTKQFRGAEPPCAGRYRQDGNTWTRGADGWSFRIVNDSRIPGGRQLVDGITGKRISRLFEDCPSGMPEFDDSLFRYRIIPDGLGRCYVDVIREKVDGRWSDV